MTAGMDAGNSYRARVRAEIERLQQIGPGDGVLVLDLLFPCFDPAARVGMDLSVRSGGDEFPLGAWKVGRPYPNRWIYCPVRTAGRRVSRCGLPLVAPIGRLDGITGLTWTVTVDGLAGAVEAKRAVFVFDRRLLVRLSPERSHGCLTANWMEGIRPPALRVNGVEPPPSQVVAIDGSDGFPGVLI